MKILLIISLFLVGSYQAHEFKLTKVTDTVYSAIGATDAPSYENRGHNNNLSVVIGEKGVLVINGGDNYQLAEELHQAIKQISNKSVIYVVNENGQGHAALGNSYWSQFDIPIIAHADAAKYFAEGGNYSLEQMQKRNKEKAVNTSVVLPTITFTDNYSLDLGGLTAELINFGPAHSPGDISVWIPEEKVLIAGDIAFHERMLGIFPDISTADWLTSFDKMMALEAIHVIPGHGSPTNMAEIKKYTYDYITFLRDKVSEILENDGDLNDAYNIDQSDWAHLDVFKELATKNAGRVYQEMEMEFF